MNVEMIAHDSGDLLPMLLDDQGMPIPAPNEFILSRRHLSPNTLVRNLNELAVLYRWLYREKIDLVDRLKKDKGFSEAEVKGGLLEFARRVQDKRTKVKKIVVTPNTFNQRLTTIRQYLGWRFDVVIGSLSSEAAEYENVLENKKRLLRMLESSFISAPPTNRLQNKGLNRKQTDFLISVVDPESNSGYGKNSAVRYRNYIMTMIMLYFGLRPGELLCLRVEDIEFGAISAIHVVRRSPDPLDTRSPRPHIKRNGRVIPIADTHFAEHLDTYITKWRDVLEENSEGESAYLILSDIGVPLSQSSITQFFQLLRERNCKELPSNFTAKSLRHTFSFEMEETLRNAGLDEDRRRQALAYLRGDSSLSSQNVYIEQEIEKYAHAALKKYQSEIILEELP